MIIQLGKTLSKKREPITNKEKLKVRKISGGQTILNFPAKWRKTLPCFKREPLIFDAHVETDENGRIFIIMEKMNYEN